MLNLPTALAERDDPVRVGVVGAGLVGTKLVNQLERAPGMTTAAVADIDVESGRGAFREAGVGEGDVTRADSTAEIDAAAADGRRALTTDARALVESDVDVVVEATGVPDVAAENAYRALTDETHVVMVSVEADAVVGPTLAKVADNAGVTYSMAYGDQPALIAELFDWARTVGLDVVAAGKGNPYREEYRHGTPDDVFERFGFEATFAEEHDLNPYMYNSFIDGTKVAVEMCAVADATGLAPDTPGLHIPTASVPEIPEVLRPEAEGGVLSESGVVETVSSIRPDGTEVDHDIDLGVFVVTETPNRQVQEYLEQMGGAGMYTASDGRYQVFHRPYHLPGTETPISVANAAVRNEPTGVACDRVGEVVAGAKRDLEPGDEIDGGGGYTVYGSLEGAGRADDRDHVPLELLDGATVVHRVERDEILTYDDVELDDESFIYRLRRVQDAL